MESQGSGRPGQQEGNHYAVLNVPFEATEEEIRRQYHAVVRTLHPDRRRPGAGSSEALEQFHKVQSAWRCLSDPTRRLLYDLRNFGRSSTNRGKEVGLDGDLGLQGNLLLEMQKEQAATDIRNMEHSLERILRREQASRGIIIRSALYGDLRLREESFEECMPGLRTIKAQDLKGPFIDVTLPVQSLVEQHTIVLPGGALASKADLPGFYNPTPLDFHTELSLYVMYEFRGHLHEVIVGDRETLSLPFRRHAVPPGKHPRGPFSPANVVMWKGSCAAMKSRSPSCGGPEAVAPSKAALEDDMIAYRFHSLRAPGPEDPTPKEFFTVAIAVCTSVALAWWWVSRDSKRIM